MRRLGSAAVAFVLVASGCGADARRERAESAVRAYVSAAGRTPESVRCTRSAHVLGQMLPSSIFVCIVKRPDGDCDAYRVVLKRGRAVVRLTERRTDCVLPIS